MSLYQLHRAIYDNMRAGEVGSGKAPAFDISSYDLTDDERESVESRDIAALYVMGLHPVLLNGFARARGIPATTTARSWLPTQRHRGPGKADGRNSWRRPRRLARMGLFCAIPGPEEIAAGQRTLAAQVIPETRTRRWHKERL